MNIVEHRFEKLRLGQQHSLSATNCSDCVQCLHPATPMLQHESHTIAYNKLARTATLSNFAIRTLEFQMTIHYVHTMKHERCHHTQVEFPQHVHYGIVNSQLSRDFTYYINIDYKCIYGHFRNHKQD